MSVAAIYDVHGNLPALEAVLDELNTASVEAIVIGGDFVWGPQPGEVLDRLRQLGDKARFIRGNTEREVAGRYGRDEGLDPQTADSVAWCADQLSADDLAFISSLPEQTVVDIPGLGETLFCHGSPRADDEIITKATPPERLSKIVGGVEQRVIVVGHTHVQFDRTVGDVRIVNAGSVGMPYEGQPGAYWAVLGPDVHLRRTTYDFAAAAASLQQSAFPGVGDLIHELFVEVTTADEATTVWEVRARAQGLKTRDEPDS